jgi:hypothetical protein
MTGERQLVFYENKLRVGRMPRYFFWLALAATLTPSAAQAQLRSTSNTGKSVDSSLTVNPPNTPIFGSILGNISLNQNATANSKLIEINNGIPIAAPTAIGNGTLNTSNILFTTPNVETRGAF